LEAFEQLSLPGRLPLIYGSLLIEAVRRQEWVEKMKRDSAALAEEIAGYQEEEQRRRRKWAKTMNDVIRVDPVETKALGVEVNLQGQDGGWPHVSREDLDEYLKSLGGVEGMEEVMESLEHAIKEMDRPTRQQVKRAKTFKNGSIHEAGFGKGSLLLRGEDETKVLREVNSKLEEELKGQKSRVRKLEDLLHRQSQVGRLSIAGGLPGQTLEPSTPPAIPSPRAPEDLSRRSSFTARRFSNQASDEKQMARRILQLEMQLSAEKEARSNLEKAMQSKEDTHEEHRREVEEAVSTKNDIMKNMEAQQKEFAQERKNLNGELTMAKERLEELEDELDRLLGSRDNERTGIDEKMQSLLNEIDQTRRDAAEEVRQADERTRDHEAALTAHQENENERRALLVGVLTHLSPGHKASGDHAELIAQLEDIAQRFADRAKELEQAVAVAKSDNESLQSVIDTQKADLDQLKAQLEAEEARSAQLGDSLTQEQSKSASTKKELEEERKHLKELREKFAAGETG
ncbi:hypothetical protein LTS18_012860, partial [Coniosporium uncinatum]